MTGDVPEDADDEPGWEVCFWVVEFGWERYSHLSGSGDDSGGQALAQGAQALAYHFGVRRP